MIDREVVEIIATIVATAGLTLTAARFIGGSSWKLSGRLTSMETTIIGVQTEMRRLGDVLEKIADMRVEFGRMDERIGHAEQDIRDLQRGEGKVLPLYKGAYEKP